MGGVRIGGAAAVQSVCPIIPYGITSWNVGLTNFWTSLWMNKHGQGPQELTSTTLNVTSNSQLIVDPMLCPTDNCLAVYAVIPNTGTVNYVNVVATNDTASPVTVATWCNSACASPNIGLDISMQPSWHPDGNLIIYKNTHANNVGNPFPRNSQIRSVAPDGSGDTQIKAIEMSTTGQFYWPQFNFDGSRIGAVVNLADLTPDSFLYTMSPSGASFTNIATLSSSQNYRPQFSWANTQDKLAYYHLDDNTVRTINGDGTGDTVIYTDADPFWGLDSRLSWALDDSAILYSQYNSGDPDPKFVIGFLDPGGGGFTPLSPERRWWGQSIRSIPRLFPQDGRIWWQEGDVNNDTYVSSVRTDGGGYTVEQDIDEALQLWDEGFAYPP